MTAARHRHRGASYVASASDGIIRTSHKVYASSSDDDSPAGFLQAAYDPDATPPASPLCAPRRQVTYSVTESEEDVSESPDAFVSNSRGRTTSGRSACAGTRTTALGRIGPSASAIQGENCAQTPWSTW